MNGERRKELGVLSWTPELAQKFWNRLAGTEFLERIAFSRFASPYLVSLVRRYFPEDARVIDFGSGYNLYLVRELLGQGFKTAFYEPSIPAKEQIERLQGDPNFLGPVQRLEAEQFDVAFLCEVIEHLSLNELSNVLDELHRGVRDGGLLVVTTPFAEDLIEASRVCPVCEHLFHPWGHVNSFTPDAVQNLLLKHGFQCEALWNVDFSSARDSIEESIALKARIGAFLKEARAQEEAGRHKGNAEESPSFATRFIGAFEELVEFSDTRDPNRCQIGLGGNIVAVAKKV